MRKALTGTALLLSLVGTTALAQSNGIPQEFPPEDYAGNQYVDSQGCAFIRAGISGNTTWVPRVDASRRQLCNFQPTFAAAPEPPAIAEAVPVPPAEDVTTAAADADLPELPLITIPSQAEAAASNAPVRVPVPARTAPPPSPRVIAAAPAPAPTSAPVESPVTEAPTPQLTSAEVCEGKFGPQPGFVSSTTGETIDCGPAPAVDIAQAPAPTPSPIETSRVGDSTLRLTSADVCEGKSGLQPGFISAATGETIDCGGAPEANISSAPVALTSAAPEPLRMTLSEICEAAKVGDRKFVDAATGAPIECPAEVQVARATVPAEPEPAPPVVAAATTCPEIPAGADQTVRCGPQIKRPWTAAGSDGASSRARVAIPGREVPVPASNPVQAAAAPARVPAGFEPVWNDGRHNPQRGIPAAASAEAVQTTHVSTRSTPISVASPYKFIQVGSFGVHSNADNLLARLQAMGLGTASGRSGALKIVAVGPFSSAADMQRALGTVRSMGFPDAFPRN